MEREESFSVLIVDDDAAEIAALNEILKNDCTVRAAKNGTGAIKRAVLNKPDIILLDVVMPDLSGFEVLQALRDMEHTKDIPVIFITWSTDAKDEERALALGAADYISKPFNPAVVRARVESQLRLVAKERARQKALYW